MRYRNFDTLFSNFTYPAGERHVSLSRYQPDHQDGPENEYGPLVIEMAARSFDDLCILITADRILKEKRLHARWFVPYFPFARHDRRINSLDGLEVSLAMSLMRNYDIDITIADPHSEATGLLPHIPQQYSVQMFQRMGLFDDNPLIAVPDAGAAKKAHTWMTSDMDAIQCDKVRDPSTGHLSGFHVPFPPGGFKGRPVVIVDDICDGGGTFIGLGKELKKHGAGPLSLAVTHGLFTKGVDDLRTMFDHIYTFHYGITPAKHPIRTTSFQALYELSQE